MNTGNHSSRSPSIWSTRMQPANAFSAIVVTVGESHKDTARRQNKFYPFCEIRQITRNSSSLSNYCGTKIPIKPSLPKISWEPATRLGKHSKVKYPQFDAFEAGIRSSKLEIKVGVMAKLKLSAILTRSHGNIILCVQSTGEHLVCGPTFEKRV